MVNHVIRPHLAHPILGLVPRGRRNDGKPGQRFGQLDEDRADAASATDHQQALLRAAPFGQAECVEQHLPRGDRGQRQPRRFGKVETGRLAPDDPFIDGMEFRIGAFARDIARIEDLIAGLKAGDRRAHLGHDACRVKAQDARRALGLSGGAQLHVDRIDRDAFHRDQQITRSHRGPVDFNHIERVRRARRAIANGFHFFVPSLCR